MGYPIPMTTREMASTRSSKCEPTFIPLDEMKAIFDAYPKRRQEDMKDPSIGLIKPEDERRAAKKKIQEAAERRKKTGFPEEAKIKDSDGQRMIVTREWFIRQLERGATVEQLMSRLNCPRRRIDQIVHTFGVVRSNYPKFMKRCTKAREK